jgi:hypothetical protein
MSLRLVNVLNGSTPDEECMRFRVGADMNLQGYALVDRTFDAADHMSNEFRHIFVFPSLDLKVGDEVFVFTGMGTQKTFSINDNLNKRYKLYWGADACVWNDKGGDVASLIQYTLKAKAVIPAV